MRVNNIILFINIFVFYVGFCYGTGKVRENKLIYSITGNISGLANGTKIYLIRMNGDTINSVNSSNGIFDLKGTYEEIGEMHFLKFDSTGLGMSNKKRTWIRLYFDNLPIHLSGNISEWPNIDIAGSPSAVKYLIILNRILDINHEYDSLYQEISQDSAAVLRLSKKLNSEHIEVYMNYLDEWGTADLVCKTRGLGYTELSSIFRALTPKVKLSYPGRLLERRIELLKPENEIKKGNILPNFSFVSVGGASEEIFDVISKSDFTLIDFWASWCGPCIDELPNLKRISNQFSTRNLQIVAISIDNRKDKWLSALNKLNMSWRQGLDNNGAISKDIFGISSIPAFVLVDRSGRMIAFSCAVSEYNSFGPAIRGKELEGTLRELIKK